MLERLIKASLAVISQTLEQFFVVCKKIVLSSESFVIQMQEASTWLGVPMSCIVPVKSYSEELELDPNCDILLLSTIIQMLRFADNYFDELSDRFSDIKIKE